MKLATALKERADVQVKINELNQRLQNNAKVQEGDIPSENPEELVFSLNECISRFEELVARINKTNSETIIENVTITELLAKKDALTKKYSIMRDFLDTASARADRYSRSEIKIQSTVDVSKLQKEVDLLSKELRMLDEKIQEANWLTELK